MKRGFLLKKVAAPQARTTLGPQKWNSADIHRAGEYRGATNQASSSAAASVPGGVSQPAAAPEQDQLDEELPSAAVLALREENVSLDARTWFTFDLRWALSGKLIRHCVAPYDVDVERLVQHLDEGLFEDCGAPHAKTDISGNWLEGYRLFYGDTELECGHKFSCYGIPHNATITVVIVSESNDAELR